MFLVIEENNNSRPEERVFQESGEKKKVKQVQVENPEGKLVWCDVTGVEENGQFVEPYAVLVDDSGAGTAYLVYGGNWGIRFRPAGDKLEWSLNEKTQWGEPFKVLDSSAEDIRFA